MFGKILLLAAILLAAFLLIRFRRRRSPPPGLVVTGADPERRRLVRQVLYGLLTLVLGGSALYYYLDWRSREEVIAVRVVNIYTGEGVRYQARRGDVGWRRFTTLDGRRITLADVERLEMEESR